jgi:CRP-like cAMP-binding protein
MATHTIDPPAEAEVDPITALSRISLFMGLTRVHLRRLAETGSYETYKGNELIFAEGQPGDRFYVLLSGAVRISRTLAGLGEEALAVLRTGNHFGEMSLIDDSPRSADARCHQKCTLFVIKKKDLEDLLFIDRDLAYELLWNFVRTLTKRLRETNDKMTFLTFAGKFS